MGTAMKRSSESRVMVNQSDEIQSHKHPQRNNNRALHQMNRLTVADSEPLINANLTADAAAMKQIVDP
jgi:hypothetical protein